MKVSFFCTLIILVALPLVALAEQTGYRLGIGDVLRVQVSGEQDLSGNYTISAEGTILFPLLGTVEATNLKVVDLAQRIRERLAADYLVDPQVAVFVQEYRSRKVAIFGDVPKPGFFYIKDDSTLLSLLTEAGLALTATDVNIMIAQAPSADHEHVETPPTIVDVKRLLSPWQNHNPVQLNGGEQIFITSGAQGKVIVSGKVNTPGVVSLREGLTVLEAINEAGGVAEFGNLSNVRVVRETPKGSEAQTVDIDAVMKGDRKKDIILEDGDIIVVPRRWF